MRINVRLLVFVIEARASIWLFALLHSYVLCWLGQEGRGASPASRLLRVLLGVFILASQDWKLTSMKIERWTMNIHDLNMLLEGILRNCPHSYGWLETAGWWITTAPVSLYWEADVKHILRKSRVHLELEYQNAYRTRKYLQPSVPGNWATSTFSRRLPEPQGWARLALLKFLHTPESPRCVSVKMSRYCRFWEAYLRTPSSNIVS